MAYRLGIYAESFEATDPCGLIFIGHQALDRSREGLVLKILQLDVRIGVALDVDHDRRRGVDDQLRAPQLDQEDRLVRVLPLLPLGRSH